MQTAEICKVHFSRLRFHTNEENRKWLPTAEASSNPLRGEKFEFLNVKSLFQTIFLLSVTPQKTPKWRPWAALTAPVSLMIIYFFPLLFRAVFVFTWFKQTAWASGEKCRSKPWLWSAPASSTALCKPCNLESVQGLCPSSPFTQCPARPCCHMQLAINLRNNFLKNAAFIYKKHLNATTPEVGMCCRTLGKLMFFPSLRFCFLAEAAWEGSQSLTEVSLLLLLLPSPFLWEPWNHTC